MPASPPPASAPSAPLRVKIVTGGLAPDGHLERMLPPGGIPGLEFFRDDAAEECDFLIMYAGMDGALFARVAPHNTLFMCGEPPGLSAFGRGFLAQFRHVGDCAPRTDHPGVRVGELGLIPHVGLVNRCFERSLADMGAAEPAKTEMISVMCSDKSGLPGHRQRLGFINLLKDHFKDRLHHYGRGFRPVPDKWDALAPYRYHIAVENTLLPNYWTEKLADPLLALSYPFYAGDPHVGALFPQDSLTAIPLHDPAGAVRIIEQGLAENWAVTRLAALRMARTAWIERHSPFAVMAAHVRAVYRPGEKQRLRIWSHKRFRPFPSGLCYALRKG